jgi:hypothetical protein
VLRNSGRRPTSSLSREWPQPEIGLGPFILDLLARKRLRSEQDNHDHDVCKQQSTSTSSAAYDVAGALHITTLAAAGDDYVTIDLTTV